MADIPKWEGIIHKIKLKLRTVFTHLHEIWSEIGYTEEIYSTYCDLVCKNVEELLNEMVTESEQKKQIIVENIEQLMYQMKTLSKELNISFQVSGYENFPLNVVIDLLHNEIQRLLSLKDQRLTHLRELLAKEKNICKILGIQPIGTDDFLPSNEELKKFKLYLEKQEEEKTRLENIFKDMRRDIIKMMDNLGVLPATNFGHLVYYEPENFVLNTNNMSQLREFHDQLVEQVETARKHMESMKNELIALWKYLDEPEYVCQSFLDNCVGYNLLTITILSREVVRCKKIRKENVAQYITQIRIELTKLWDLCRYSEAQRQQFPHFNSQTYTENILTLHELEVERVQKFYESNKPIFDLFEELEYLWMKMKELLQCANKPDRFHNRGGQLLMEEKERKKIQIKLPKIEKELKRLMTEYKVTHNEDFLINGLTVDKLLKESWENLNGEKQTIMNTTKEVKYKLSKKTTLSTSKKVTSISSSIKIPTVISTRHLNPLSLAKRKLLKSPSPNTSAKHKKSLSAINRSKIAKSGKSPKRILKSGNTLSRSEYEKKHLVSHSLAATDTTYSHFKEHLEKKKQLRSSLLP